MIYVHIPFCASKRNYCAFNSKVSNAEEIAAYVDAPISEIKSFPYTSAHGRIFLQVKK